MTVGLATSRYAEFDPAMGAPVRITVGLPKFPLRYRIAAEVDELKPAGRLFRLEDDEFVRAYRAQLDAVGVVALRSRFAAVGSNVGSARLVLLCFEPANQPCHRRVFAAWWEEHTGEVVPEVGPAQLSLP